ncbi:hypothetical protein [Amycolatopsis pretoriensis]|uniref:hypothetical protein n=1 Tax=Amycolatopsis pretoriensis TaxID=218821 RepID=UPI001FC9701E|nr:hypothetical protein [Amycolatopsis pretoriensis]
MAGAAGAVLTEADRDLRLLDRVRDLHTSLALDLSWLARTLDDETPRPDIVRDLGERLADLGADLVARADELDARVRATLPDHGWLPEAGARRRALAVAHQVGPHPLRCGPIFLAVCGAACFPFYGTDPTGRTVRHERCERCLHVR